MRYAALLRGINVNPRSRVAMSDLRALLAGLGLRRPRLPPLLEKRSKAPATMRNRNTVTRLPALAES
ncbi:DUF1697 domain-containing protein [Streptosporangium sp. 'caverna']|uniref:DUF1697 domain-containing protein n=1 Tax=Streptosporangium sp. 'caverna' TaxID=2202249 RepID=UPI000D7E5130|nr:DUF1697 domain-containing protein [Streptosporangium sp. 'caverna']AWS44801.1 hypothetical protein DKM19_29235 [Streptosporangium sp. 'caverna']